MVLNLVCSKLLEVKMCSRSYGIKSCSRCKMVKTFDEFNRDYKANDGRDSRCRACQKEINYQGRERIKNSYGNCRFCISLFNTCGRAPAQIVVMD